MNQTGFVTKTDGTNDGFLPYLDIVLFKRYAFMQWKASYNGKCAVESRTMYMWIPLQKPEVCEPSQNRRANCSFHRKKHWSCGRWLSMNCPRGCSSYCKKIRTKYFIVSLRLDVEWGNLDYSSCWNWTHGRKALSKGRRGKAENQKRCIIEGKVHPITFKKLSVVEGVLSKSECFIDWKDCPNRKQQKEQISEEPESFARKLIQRNILSCSRLSQILL